MEIDEEVRVGERIGEISKLSKKIAHIQKAMNPNSHASHCSHYTEPTMGILRKRMKHRKKLTYEELIGINYKVRILN